MSKNFDMAFDALMEHEGGYVDNKNDPGGETKFGITLKVALDHGYKGDMANLDLITAKAIYATTYWPKCLDELPFKIAFNVFDGAVNSGLSQSIKWLQRSLGIKEDGLLGPETIAGSNKQNPEIIAVKFNVNRMEFLTGNHRWSFFGKGWARRIAKNLAMSVA